MNPDLEDYYRELILEHGRCPACRGALSGATHWGLAEHPLKGERMEVFLRVEGEVIKEAAFEGEGSALALASASLMCQRVRGKSLREACELVGAVRAMLQLSLEVEPDVEALGDLAALAGVRQFPARVDCTLLAWEALEKAC